MVKRIMELFRIVGIWILSVLITGLGVVSLHYLPRLSVPLQVDYPILGQGDGFSMSDGAGQIHHSGEWLGKVVLLNFWATWCPPCRKEIPGFVNLYRTYRDQGLMVVGVAIDSPDTIRRFITEFNVDYLNLLGEYSGMEWAIRYGNRGGGLPYTVIIDRAGKVVSTHLGELSAPNAERAIRPLL